MNRSGRFKNIIFQVLLIISLSLVQDNSLADNIPEANYDTSTVELRIPTNEFIQDFKTDRNFVYERAQNPLQNWWQRLWLRAIRFISGIFSNSGFAPFFRYIFFILLLFLLIYKIADSRYQNIFSRNRQKINFKLKEVEENINEIDLDAEIESLLQQKNFRGATRYMYLKLLKILSQKSFINWSPEKTNRDYMYELGGSDYQLIFRDLSSVYEYVWYGHFDLDNAQFEPINENFQNTFSQLNAR